MGFARTVRRRLRASRKRMPFRRKRRAWKAYRRGPGRRRGGIRGLAKRLRSHLTTKKVLTGSLGTRVAPATMAPIYALFWGTITHGDGPEEREGEKLRWNRYTWDGLIGGMHLAASEHARSNYRTSLCWEFVIWWKGDMARLGANTQLIFRDNTTNRMRLHRGFSTTERRNFKVLWSRKHTLGIDAEGTALGAASQYIDDAVALGANAGMAPRWKRTHGSIKVPHVSRYVGAGPSTPTVGGLVHYYVPELEPGILSQQCQLISTIRSSYFDD